ncbi:MAG: single-stranded DNA-binding protein [candidate division Zixibacteria bacterium]|nr:single-stranded DNA-binding protein [candidate division Zixibacteria bacterium]
MALPYLNKVMITGRLVRSPELRMTNAGVPVSNFKIACNKEYLDEQDQPKDEVCYIGIATWHNLAKACKEKLDKGTDVHIEGELKSRLRRNSNGIKRSFVEIRASRVKFLNSDGLLEDLGGEGLGDTALMPVEDTVSATVTNNPATVSNELADDSVAENESPFSLVSNEHEEL